MTASPQANVLVIDDETSIRESFRFFLEDLGYSVAEAVNGRDGLAQFKKNPADIVLVDLRMPEIDGHQVLARLAADSPDTPVIVISGTGRIDDTVQALHLGAWDYILKPVTDLTMVEYAITKALERARLLRENREHQQQLEEEVERRTAELTQKMEEMTRFNRMAIGRERRVVELKRLVNTLLGELGREPRFKSPNMLEEDPSLLN